MFTTLFLLYLYMFFCIVFMREISSFLEIIRDEQYGKTNGKLQEQQICESVTKSHLSKRVM